MLPFLKHSKEASAASPVESIKRDHDEDHEYDGLEMAMEELAGHLSSKDWKAAAQCFRAAAELVDSQPHKEGEHI